jgi:hypothetical protein
MHRSWLSGIVAASVTLICITPAAGQQACRPTLAFTQVQLSPMRPPDLERQWTAVVSVDASRCAASSTGTFQIGFSRLKEMGADLDFRQQFTWRPPSVNVHVDFAPDEAVERYWIENISSCPCAR